MFSIYITSQPSHNVFINCFYHNWFCPPLYKIPVVVAFLGFQENQDELALRISRKLFHLEFPPRVQIKNVYATKIHII